MEILPILLFYKRTILLNLFGIKHPSLRLIFSIVMVIGFKITKKKQQMVLTGVRLTLNVDIFKKPVTSYFFKRY